MSGRLHACHQVLERPATSAVTALLCGIHLLIASRGISYAEVGLSYEAAVQKLQLWRLVSAQLAHIELLHLLFNASSLWSLGIVETAGSRPDGRSGSLYYVQISLVLLVFSGVVRPVGGQFPRLMLVWACIGQACTE